MKQAITIPQKYFLELCGTIKESESKEQFSFDELRRQRDYYAVLEYLRRTNVKYIDEGSSRVAFYLPNAIDGDGNTIDTPCCLKVASCEFGVGQNKSDIRAYQRFGEDFQCFPRMYSFDEKNKFYFLCELATPALSLNEKGKAYINSYEYFSDLIAFISNKKYSEPILKSIQKMRDINGFLDELFEAYDLVHYGEERADYTKEEIEKFSKEWVSFWTVVKKRLPKYAGIADVSVGFIKRTFYDSDIDTPNNWGYVKRNGELVLLPIDFGVGES